MVPLALRPLGGLGYPPIRDLLGSRADSTSPAWLEEITVVYDGPRLLVTSPNGAVGRPTGFHGVIDRDGDWWALRITRDHLIAYGWRDGPLADAAEVARCLTESALAIDLGELEHRLPISAERIERAFVQHPANPGGWSDHERAVRSRLDAAFDRFLAEHRRYGGWRFHGRPDATSPRGYAGPLFWKEEDVRFRLALELEREFPGAVHLEVLLTDATTIQWDPAQDGVRQFVDVQVGDFRGFRDGLDALERFRSQPALLLAEVKFLAKGRRGDQLMRELEYIRKDVARLARHLDLERTSHAAMVVVADDDQLAEAFAGRGPFPAWQHAVELIHARPPSPLLDSAAPGLPFPWGIRTHRDLAMLTTDAETHEVS